MYGLTFGLGPINDSLTSWLSPSHVLGGVVLGLFLVLHVAIVAMARSCTPGFMECAPMTSLTLVPMTGRDLDAFVQAQVADYAQERVLDGSWSRSEARECAWADLIRVIAWEHKAARAERQRLLTALTSSGESVGWLWVKLGPPGPSGRSAFLCQMTVAPAVRQQGYGRAMLAALEAMLAAEGFVELRLNVCEANLPAKRLYAAAGFELVAQHATMRQLRKRLTSELQPDDELTMTRLFSPAR